MKILSNTKKTEATSTPKFGCDFCGRSFIKETTIAKHICEYKQRFLNKDLVGNRIGFQAYVEFYKKNSNAKKTKTYDDFMKSAYYIAFVKFGNYCSEIHALNVPRFVDWLLKNQIKIDNWNTDSVYTKFLLEYLREENPHDAITRSINECISIGQYERIKYSDVLRYCNKNKICYAITTGKISPWLLYQSQSGIRFLDSLDDTQIKMILDYINPELWAIKFKKFADEVSDIKNKLHEHGY